MCCCVRKPTPLLRQHASPLINHPSHTNIPPVTVFGRVRPAVAAACGRISCSAKSIELWRSLRFWQPRIAHALGAALDIDDAVGVAAGAYRDAAEFGQSAAELGAVAGRLLWP